MAVKTVERVQPESQPTEHPHIDRMPGVCGGRPKIRGHRIAVWIIANWHHMNMSASDIAEMYPQLTPGDINRLHREWVNQTRDHYGIILSTQEPAGLLVRRCLNLLATLDEGDMRNRLDWLNRYK